MRDAMVKLSELSDPVAFLTGARIPLITHTSTRIEVVGGFAVIILANGLCGLHALSDCNNMGWSLDCSHPDAAQWCDRQIATSLGLPNPEHAVLSYGNEWCFWLLGDECPRFIGDLRTELASAVCGIPCTDANIPIARAALLRALFGVSNA